MGHLRWVAAATLCSILLLGCSQPRSTGAVPNYARPGPFNVVVTRVGTDGSSFAVFRPSPYSALSFPSPIVTWGNGTGANPSDYGTLLSHLASWGFTVIASTLPDTGSGRQLLQGAHDLVDADDRMGSPFFHHLSVHEVAAVGHSQGATGAVRAAESGGSFISAVVAFSLPWNGHGPTGSTWDRPVHGPEPLGWSGANPGCPTALDCWPDPGLLRQPTFLISTRGPLDAVIANPGVERCYFDEIKAPAALGLVRRSDGKRADHLSIEDTANGGNPGGLLAYTTAWLLAELRHDPTAAGLFFGRRASLVESANWSGSQVKTAWSGDGACG